MSQLYSWKTKTFMVSIMKFLKLFWVKILSFPLVKLKSWDLELTSLLLGIQEMLSFHFKLQNNSKNKVFQPKSSTSEPLNHLIGTLLSKVSKRQADWLLLKMVSLLLELELKLLPWLMKQEDLIISEDQSRE